MALRNAQKSKAATRAGKHLAVVVPSMEDAPLFEGDAEPLDVDVEAHLRWLETGEGEPWPPGSSS